MGAAEVARHGPGGHGCVWDKPLWIIAKPSDISIWSYSIGSFEQCRIMVE